MSIHAYEPLRLELGLVTYRSIPLSWHLNYVVVSSNGEVTLRDSSYISVDFFPPNSTSMLPKGAYTAGIIVESPDDPFDGVIQVSQNNVVVKECPVTVGAVTCYGYAVPTTAIAGFNIRLKRRDGGKATFHAPVLKKIVVDVPI